MGDALVDNPKEAKGAGETRHSAQVVVNRWRFAHLEPLHEFRRDLYREAKRFDENVIVISRLKGLTSIEEKLGREQDPGNDDEGRMKLSQMQDVAGCRAIVYSIADVEPLAASTGWTKHDRSKTYDYINNPKPSGYRGIHVVHRYRHDVGDGSESVLNGLRVEIQFRSELQHAWATAVETIDTLRGTQLKTHTNREPAWERFFSLMGSAFAKKENGSPVPGTPRHVSCLREEVVKLVKRLNVPHYLLGFGTMIHTVSVPKRAEWILLHLDLKKRRTWIDTFARNEREKAQAKYLKTEEAYEVSRERRCCLVSKSSVDRIRQAYPNYFLDAALFADALYDFMGQPIPQIKRELLPKARAIAAEHARTVK